MNMHDVIISIQSSENSPRPPFASSGSAELIVTGKYGFENGESRFCYEESDLTGLNGTHTTFSVKQKEITMRREGTTHAELHFREGKQDYYLYETPFGAASMGLKTDHIENKLDEHGGTMEFAYQLAYNNAPYEVNKFKFHVKEANHV